jgi:hypothetical protein
MADHPPIVGLTYHDANRGSIVSRHKCPWPVESITFDFLFNRGSIARWHECPWPLESITFDFLFFSFFVSSNNQKQVLYHATIMSDDDISLPGSLSTIESGVEKRGAASGKDSNVSSAARLLIQQDSKSVGRSKLVVLLMISIATVATSIAVHKFAKESEEADFEVRVSIPDQANSVEFSIPTCNSFNSSLSSSSRTLHKRSSLSHRSMRPTSFKSMKR